LIYNSDFCLFVAVGFNSTLDMSFTICEKIKIKNDGNDKQHITCGHLNLN